MNLEEFIARTNASAFWNEFTFDENQFTPQPGAELELADNLVWFGDFAIAMQLKQRGNPTDDADTEKRWFDSKVLSKATKQVRDTLRYLNENDEIQIRNRRGHTFAIRNGELSEVVKIVVYLGAAALPDQCRQKQFHVSDTAGYIHIIAAHDYLGIVETLGVPEDIRRYFEYRETVTQRLLEEDSQVDEQDIMGGFLTEENTPTTESRSSLERLVQDFDEFDLSPLIGNLHDNIERSENPEDYYKIMQEFARVPRSVWREIKLRFMRSLDAVRDGNFEMPFRLSFPASDCAFMIAPLDPEIVAVGVEGEQNRVTGLTNLAYAAKYDAQTSKGIGILISRDTPYFQIDWTLIESEWVQNDEMERMMQDNNPFRTVREQSIDSFYIRD